MRCPKPDAYCPVLFTLLAVVLCTPVNSAVAQTMAEVRLGVQEALARSADGSVYVVVTLHADPAASRSSLSQRQLQVATVQERVLCQLGKGEFRVVYRYENFAALTGYVTAAGMQRLATHPDVKQIGLDQPGEAHLASSVPFINGYDVYDLGFTGEGFTVAVLDTGIDPNHPDLSDNIAPGAYHFLNKGGDVGPGAWNYGTNAHGTNVAGIITSKGDVAFRGVAPNADILAIQVLDAGGNGWVSDWAAGVDHVVTLSQVFPIMAINMSLGTNAQYTDCPCDDSDPNWTDLLQASLQSAWDAGIVTFASSGNKGHSDRMSSPACLSSAVAVAAVYDANYLREPDSNTYGYYYSGFPYCSDDPTYGDLITCFSNRSPCNHLAAPGRRITAPGLNNGTSEYTGTSQASPHCAGVAALIAHRCACLGTWPPPQTIVGVMERTGVATVDPYFTSPNPIRVDALAAVNEFDMQRFAAYDGQDFDEFGRAVAVDGQYTVVGAISAPGSRADTGAAYVFVRQGGAWEYQAKLTPGTSLSGYFGCSVSIDGDRAVCGADQDRSAAYWAGAAYVFHRSGTTWTREAQLLASDAHSEDRFGWSVGISGDRVVVGSPQDDDVPGQSGSAYVFRFDDPVWVQEQKLTASDADNADYFGYSVAIDGDLLVVGAYRDEDGGSAYVFRREGTTWIEEDKLVASDHESGDEFGTSVSISGELIVVGAPKEDEAQSNSGSAYVFRREGATWVQETKLHADDAYTGDAFGHSVSIRGGRIVVGVPFDDISDGSGIDEGSAYVYLRQPDRSWTLLTKLRSWRDEGVVGQAHFGYAVSASEGRTIIGERGYDYFTGVTYSFAGVSDCNGNDELDIYDVAGGASEDLDDTGLPDECEGPELCPGDASCDDKVDFGDINPFVDAMLCSSEPDPEACWSALHPGCPYLNADVDESGAVSFGDINPFVALLTTQSLPIPCP